MARSISRRRADEGVELALQRRKSPKYKKSGLWKNHKFLGKLSVKPVWAAPAQEQYRLISTGAGKTKISAWSKHIVKC